jgi:uncharacterized membrane protein
MSRRWLGPSVRGLLLLLGVLPLLPRLFAPIPGLGFLAEGIEAWFLFQCHREPSRSLLLLGEILPVCTRCAGIYFGLGLGALFVRPKLDVWPLRIWVAVAALLMVLDVATELVGLRPESPVLRLFSGVLLAYPVAVVLVLATRQASVARA